MRVGACDLPELCRLLSQRGVIACPTETLMGLLADARDPLAVARVCALKGRDASAPIGVLLPDPAALDAICAQITPLARALAQRYWPGPLTLVLPVRPGWPQPLSKDGKIGVRVPGPSPALDLVRAFGAPLTATSANESGRPAARTAQQAQAIFGGELAAIVPGEAPGGPASTVVDVSGERLRMLRAGAISEAELRSVTGI